MGDFWERTPLPAKLALVLVAVAAVLNAASYAGLGMNRPVVLYGFVHIALMAIGVWAMVLLYRLNALRWRGVPAGPRGPGLPAPLWVAVVVAAIYLAVVALLLAASGEGGPEIVDGRRVWVDGARVVRELSEDEYRHAQAMLLRTFSAAWLAFALGLAATHDRVAAGIARRGAR